eukprot:CAMPEP_0180332940 /NCGR_PEP_ID=MMETSP0988-20121125/42804_1 /TAXON_ID=697907 /ORGANISM="non described non described, Strain CCMP2293" /LENGTH=146 /DNA_ID=CAMNT_0022320627 /DNA_START=113 /DNA_END=553 /DNA_ORIENTATION=-
MLRRGWLAVPLLVRYWLDDADEPLVHVLLEEGEELRLHPVHVPGFDGVGEFNLVVGHPPGRRERRLVYALCDLLVAASIAAFHLIYPARGRRGAHTGARGPRRERERRAAVLALRADELLHNVLVLIDDLRPCRSRRAPAVSRLEG